MILHDDTLLSENILEKQFVCDLNACKGACCIEGDRGAPLVESEITEIGENLDVILEELPHSHQKHIQKNGFYEKDVDGELVTNCRDNGECVFVVREEGQLKCAIEISNKKGKSKFLKPISCHLYPIRLIKAGEYTGLNYHQWNICSAACTLGKKLKVKVFEFLKEPLIRKFGQKWYEDLEEIAAEYSASK